ncbi:SRPBCC family protein [Streptomyces lateritius]|nr:SRPBCC family protein [Streptomyces lateritius]
MSMVEQTIDVDVPVRTAYNQWTQFEEFPKFMEGVEEVRQIDDRHSHWQTKVAGVRREFDTEIIDQLPDERISWRTVAGDTRQKGVVSFQQLDSEHTRVRLAMDVEADGMMEKLGEAVGVLDRRVKGDLKRFKGYVEEHGHESGGWRGRVRPADADTAQGPVGGMTGEGPGPVRGEPGPTTGMTGTTGMGAAGGLGESRPVQPRPDDPDSIDRI